NSAWQRRGLLLKLEGRMRELCRRANAPVIRPVFFQPSVIETIDQPAESGSVMSGTQQLITGLPEPSGARVCIELLKRRFVSLEIEPAQFHIGCVRLGKVVERHQECRRKPHGAVNLAESLSGGLGQ